MRFFTIGMGNGISPILIQGVAKAGLGDYDFVKDDENVEEKTQYLIDSAITPLLKDFKVVFSKPGQVIKTIPEQNKIGFVQKNKRFELLLFLKESFMQNPVDLLITYYDQYKGRLVKMNVDLNPKYTVTDDVIVKMAVKKDIDDQIMESKLEKVSEV